jgi:8-oxo-dGTP diphosphatase
MDTPLIVAAIIRQEGRILLVEQQGPSDLLPTWSLPGGVVEAGELLTEALDREVREETGLAIEDLGALAYVTQNIEGDQTSVAFVFEVGRWRGKLRIGDPDGLILRAVFLPLAEALRALEGLPWPIMRAPAIAYLTGHAEAGSLWACQARHGMTPTIVTSKVTPQDRQAQ